MARGSNVPKEHTTHPITGRPCCGSKVRKTESNPYGICLRYPSTKLTNGRCYKHGRGGAPVTKGTYTKHRVPQFFKKLEEAKADTELASTRRELAILRVFIDEELSEYVNSSNEKNWEAAAKALSKMIVAVAQEDWAVMGAAVEKMSTAIKSGTEKIVSQDRIRSLIRDYASVAKIESDRELALGNLIHKKQVLAIVKQLTDAVITAVAEPKVIQLVLTQFNRILEGGSGTGPSLSSSGEGDYITVPGRSQDPDEDEGDSVLHSE